MISIPAFTDLQIWYRFHASAGGIGIVRLEIEAGSTTKGIYNSLQGAAPHVGPVHAPVGSAMSCPGAAYRFVISRNGGRVAILSIIKAPMIKGEAKIPGYR